MTVTLDKIDGVEQGARPAPVLPRPKAAKRSGALIDWRVLLAGVIAAGLVHIAVVFTTPRTSPAPALVRLKPLLPANKAVTMPAPTPAKQPFPFVMPEALYAFCRFDLSVDNLRVSAVLPEPGWTLSLHSAFGDNFYIMPGQQKRTDITFVIAPGIASAEIGSSPRRFGSGDVQIPAPTLEGIVMVRAPLKGLAYRAETEAMLARTSCTPAKR
ncbi:MAG: DUF1254 domain-containing protein [Hyphomicrobiales bacterium]|nr:MAG: DUF1254 domain-containing protein [Hyphomicrobiales bacterium]